MAWRVGFVKRFESSLSNAGLIEPLRDGAHAGVQDGTVPVRKPLDEPSFYTKQYRLVLDGRPVSTVIKFVYNLRDGWADFDMHYKRLPGKTAQDCQVSPEEIEQKLEPAAGTKVSRG